MSSSQNWKILLFRVFLYLHGDSIGVVELTRGRAYWFSHKFFASCNDVCTLKNKMTYTYPPKVVFGVSYLIAHWINKLTPRYPKKKKRVCKGICVFSFWFLGNYQIEGGVVTYFPLIMPNSLISNTLLYFKKSPLFWPATCFSFHYEFCFLFTSFQQDFSLSHYFSWSITIMLFNSHLKNPNLQSLKIPSKPTKSSKTCLIMSKYFTK